MKYLDTNIVISMLRGSAVHEQVMGSVISYDVAVESYTRLVIAEQCKVHKLGKEFGRDMVIRFASSIHSQIKTLCTDNNLYIEQGDLFDQVMEKVKECGLDYVDCSCLVRFGAGDDIITSDTQLIHYMMSKDAVVRSQVETIRDGARVLGLTVDDVSVYRAYRAIPESCKEQAVLAHKIYEEAHSL